MPGVSQSVLSDELLSRCHGRAATYDRENRFFQEDFDELREAGYLLMAVPREFGGHGMTLAEVGRETRRLAYHAPATALATQHAPLLGRRRRRPVARRRQVAGVDPRAKRRPAKSSPPATPKRATTSRSCSRRRRPSAWKAATRSPVASRSAA